MCQFSSPIYSTLPFHYPRLSSELAIIPKRFQTKPITQPTNTASASALNDANKVSILEPLKTAYPNTSKTTLELQDEQWKNVDAFTTKRLTENGQGIKLKPEAEEIIDIFDNRGISGHQQPIVELGKRSQVVRAMNKSGGLNINVQVLSKLRQIKQRAQKR